jgi:hypothetical protein
MLLKANYIDKKICGRLNKKATPLSCTFKNTMVEAAFDNKMNAIRVELFYIKNYFFLPEL